jgi:hypothetical protein
MAENARKFNFLKKEAVSYEESVRREILEALKDTHSQLTNARLGFDNVSDPELVDASVYEINSLQARYSYLLRKAREEGCTVNGVFRKPR